MAQTPLTGSSPYLTAARYWLYKDERPTLELLADDDTKPTRADAENASATAGGRLLAALKRASGDIEQYAMSGGKYEPADLAAIVAGNGNGAALIESMVADLAFWTLAKRRWPSVQAKDVAGAQEALDDLQKLRDGVTIFGTVEAVEAGNVSVTTLDPGDNRRTVRASVRYFGNREPRGTNGMG
jgi:hypothetical protein